jgi:hypothetical protein
MRTLKDTKRRGNPASQACRWRLSASLVAFASVLAGGEALAQSEGALQGAWSMVGTECPQVFEFSNGQPEFRDRGSSINTGIIIRGKTMIGPMSTCSIGRITESQGLYKVSLNCSSSIMFDEISVSLKLVDAQHFHRIDPDFPEISREYQKCSA